MLENPVNRRNALGILGAVASLIAVAGQPAEPPAPPVCRCAPNPVFVHVVEGDLLHDAVVSLAAADIPFRLTADRSKSQPSSRVLMVDYADRVRSCAILRAVDESAEARRAARHAE